MDSLQRDVRGRPTIHCCPWHCSKPCFIGGWPRFRRERDGRLSYLIQTTRTETYFKTAVIHSGIRERRSSIKLCDARHRTTCRRQHELRRWSPINILRKHNKDNNKMSKKNKIHKVTTLPSVPSSIETCITPPRKTTNMLIKSWLRVLNINIYLSLLYCFYYPCHPTMCSMIFNIDHL